MSALQETGRIVAVSRDAEHRFSKPVVEEITLVTGWGVEGDAHAGTTVQHRSRVARDPSQPNLRQVHLLHAEVFDEVAAAGHTVVPGDMGRTSPRAASTCSDCRRVRCSTSVTRRACA